MKILKNSISKAQKLIQPEPNRAKTKPVFQNFIILIQSCADQRYLFTTSHAHLCRSWTYDHCVVCRAWKIVDRSSKCSIDRSSEIDRLSKKKIAMLFCSIDRKKIAIFFWTIEQKKNAFKWIKLSMQLLSLMFFITFEKSLDIIILR